MRPKSLILIAIALGCGLVASIGISQVMDSRANNNGPAAMETAKILVAAYEVNVGEIIEAGMLKVEEWPRDKIPEGATTKLEEAVGERPRQRIFVGEPILEQKLIGAGDQADDASTRLRKGYRAVTVKVTEDAVVAGLLKPGDRVDILAYFKRGVNFSQTIMKTILEDVRVFAVNRKMDRTLDEGKGKVVAKTLTLEVLPSQVEVLSLANEIGRLRFSARRPDDESRRDTDGAVPADLHVDHSTSVREKAGLNGQSMQDWLGKSGQQPQPNAVDRRDSSVIDIIEPDRIHRWELLDGQPPRELPSNPVTDFGDDLDLLISENGETDG